MSSDDSSRQGSSGFRPVGTGMRMTFRCGNCDQPSSDQGKRKRKTPKMGVTWVCAACNLKLAS